MSPNEPDNPDERTSYVILPEVIAAFGGRPLLGFIWAFILTCGVLLFFTVGSTNGSPRSHRLQLFVLGCIGVQLASLILLLFSPKVRARLFGRDGFGSRRKHGPIPTWCIRLFPLFFYLLAYLRYRFEW